MEKFSERFSAISFLQLISLLWATIENLLNVCCSQYGHWAHLITSHVIVCVFQGSSIIKYSINNNVRKLESRIRIEVFRRVHSLCANSKHTKTDSSPFFFSFFLPRLCSFYVFLSMYFSADHFESNRPWHTKHARHTHSTHTRSHKISVCFPWKQANWFCEWPTKGWMLPANVSSADVECWWWWWCRRHRRLRVCIDEWWRWHSASMLARSVTPRHTAHRKENYRLCAIKRERKFYMFRRFATMLLTFNLFVIFVINNFPISPIHFRLGFFSGSGNIIFGRFTASIACHRDGRPSFAFHRSIASR